MFRKIFNVIKKFSRMKSQLTGDEMNLSIVLHRSNDLELEVRPIPIPRENELLIRVGYVCLSDLDLQFVTLGPSKNNQGYNAPYVLGSQVSGIVVRAGVGVEENFKEGDRVVLDPGVACHNCDFCKQERYNLCPKFSYLGTADRPGALCRFVVHPMRFCYKIPQHIGLDDGSLCTRLASGIHAFKRAGIDKNSVVAIVGTGFAGITMVLTCKLMGLKNVVVIEFNEYRLNLARRYGAEYAVKFKPNTNPDYLKEIMKEIMGRLPDVVFETGVIKNSLEIASTIAQSGGQVVVVGPRPERVKTGLHHITCREIDIRGVFTVGQSFQEAVQYMKGGHVRAKDLRPIIVPLENALEAINIARVNVGGNAFVLIECYDEHK